MSKYDYFIAGRTRNRDAIKDVLAQIRARGRTAYCFIENKYDSDGITFDPESDAAEQEMAAFESLADWQTNPTFREIFEDDMDALRNAETFIIVLPAGLSAHMELGVAYGLGKKCYAIGIPEKPESLYLMLDEILPDTKALLEKTT